MLGKHPLPVTSVHKAIRHQVLMSPVVADLQRQVCCMRGGLLARLNRNATLLQYPATGTKHGVRRCKDSCIAENAKPQTQLLMVLEVG